MPAITKSIYAFAGTAYTHSYKEYTKSFKWEDLTPTNTFKYDRMIQKQFNRYCMIPKQLGEHRIATTVYRRFFGNTFKLGGSKK